MTEEIEGKEQWLELQRRFLCCVVARCGCGGVVMLLKGGSMVLAGSCYWLVGCI